MNKQLIGIAAILFVAYFFTTPFLAANSLKNAIEEQDVKAFEEYVDVNAIKQKIMGDALKGCDGKPLCTAGAVATINLVTSGVLLSQLTINPASEFKLGYHSFNRFVITNVASGASVWMKRDGVFGWKVYKFEA